MRKNTKRRWIAAVLISAILSGIIANQFCLSAQTDPEGTSQQEEVSEIEDNQKTKPTARSVTTPVVKLYINEVDVEFSGYLINETTYVPLRAICETLDDCQISWNNGIAYVNNEHISMSVQQGSNYIEANERIIFNEQPILNIDSRIYVPIRSLAKAYSMNVEWHGISKSVYLSGDPKGLKKGKDFYSDEDLYWLSRIIHAESSGEPIKGKIAVGNVIINRKNRSDYPSTIKAVIFDKKHGTQFTPVANGTIYNKPANESIIAAKIVLEGYSISDKIIFFINPKIATNFWIIENRTFVIKIGNHSFYK